LPFIILLANFLDISPMVFGLENDGKLS